MRELSYCLFKPPRPLAFLILLWLIPDDINHLWQRYQLELYRKQNLFESNNNDNLSHSSKLTTNVNK